MIVVLTVIQLCVTISFCVWTGEALCKNDEDAKVLYHQNYYINQSVKPSVIMRVSENCSVRLFVVLQLVEDPEPQKLLIEDATAGPGC